MVGCRWTALRLLPLTLMLLSLLLPCHSLCGTSVVCSMRRAPMAMVHKPRTSIKRLIRPCASASSGGEAPALSSILSSTVLVSGTAVGAGILALASSSVKAGFMPSVVGLTGCWMFLVVTGLLIAEVSCNLAVRSPSSGTDTSQRSASSALGIIGMTSELLGQPGAATLGVAYVFNHYALLVAYIAEAGKLLGDALHLPTVVGPLLFATVIGGSVALGSTAVVEMMNNVFFCIVIASFLSLAGLGMGSMNIGSLGYQNYAELPEIIPILLIALVYHNVVPSISLELGYHKPSIRTAVALGSFIPLMMFIIWNAVVLGQISDYSVVADAAQGIDPLKLLMSNIPPAMQPLTEALITIFSESAIITSFIGFYISLREFYRDLIPERGNYDPYLIALILAPPTLISSFADPSIFIRALDISGTYGTTLLSGALPAMLAWRMRDSLELQQEESNRIRKSNCVGVWSALAVVRRQWYSFVEANQKSLDILMRAIQIERTTADSREAQRDGASEDTEGGYITLVPGGKPLLFTVIGTTCATVLEKISVVSAAVH